MKLYVYSIMYTRMHSMKLVLIVKTTCFREYVFSILHLIPDIMNYIVFTFELLSDSIDIYSVFRLM